MRFRLHHSTGDPDGPAKISCCCYHPVRPRIYVAIDNRVVEYDLATGRELGSRAESSPVTDMHCSSALNCLVALIKDHVVRVYKELAVNGGSCLRPAADYFCTRQGRDEERVKCCALSHVVQRDGGCAFFFGKVGRANVYALNLFAGANVGDVVKVAGCKKALRTEPYEIVTHPSRPVFVALSDSAAVVGNEGFMLFELATGAPTHERLHSLSFHPTLPRMLGVCGRDLLCWDVSNMKSFTIIGRVQMAHPAQGVYFLPGMSPYFFSLVLTPAASVGVESWFIDESQQQPLQKSVTLDTSVLTNLAVRCSRRNRCGIFPHSTLPVAVVVGRSSFAVVQCADRQHPLAATPTHTPLHLSIGMVESVATVQEARFFPRQLYFMQQGKLWTYCVATASCKEMQVPSSLPATATAVVKMESFIGQEDSSCVFLVNAQMEFGGGTRAAFLLCTGRDARRRNCRDASLLGVTCWDSVVTASRAGPIEAVAACISEDGLQLIFEGSDAALAQHDLSSCTGPHGLGSIVNRVFVTPLGGGKGLLYVDTLNVVRFSRNVVACSDNNGQWAVWTEGPSLRLHGDESVIHAMWQCGEDTDSQWQPVLALVTSRRAMLLSIDLEVLAHVEGRTEPLGVPSGVWCGVVFLYTTPEQIRWLAVDGSNGALVSLPAPNAVLFGVISDRVLVLVPDGHSSYVHAVPVTLLEPLAVGWIASTLALRTSATMAVQQVSALIKTSNSGFHTVSSALLAAIVALLDALQNSTSGSPDRTAKERIAEIGLSIAFSASGAQFPLQLRLAIALHCRAHQLAFDALLEEWARNRICAALPAHSPLGQLFDRLGSACSLCGELALAQSCHRMLHDRWQIRAAWGQANPSKSPKTFLDVLTQQSGLLPSTSISSPARNPSDTARIRGLDPVRCGTNLSDLVEVAVLGAARKSWATMAGVQSHAQRTEHDALWRPQGNSGLADRVPMSSLPQAVPSVGAMGHVATGNGKPQHALDSSGEEGSDDGGAETEPASGLASAGWSLDHFTDSSDEDTVGQMPKRISISIKPRVSADGEGSVGRSVSDVLALP